MSAFMKEDVCEGGPASCFMGIKEEMDSKLVRFPLTERGTPEGREKTRLSFYDA